MDTNIDNYSDNELLEIIGLDNVNDKKEIESKINGIIARLHKRDDNNFLQFFKNVKERLLNEEEEEEEHPQQAEVWLQNQFLPPTNNFKKERLTNRSNAFELLESPYIPIMHRKNLGISNSIPLEVAQDSLNPNLRQKETRIIMIDSKDRPIIIPFTNNPLEPSSSTNFTCNLSINLQNIISMRISSVFIPKTFYVIDKFKANNFFFVQEWDNSINDVSGILYRVTLPDGNYKIQNLITALNNSLKNSSSDESGNIIKDLYQDIEFNLDPELVISILQGYTNTRLKIINKSNKHYKITFYDRFTNLNTKNSCSSINYYTTSLAYYLGFRFELDKKLKSNSFCEIKIPDLWSIILKPKDQKDSFYLAQTIPNIVGPRYFNLCIDDFQNNQSSSSFVNIKNIDNKLSLPSYINKLNQDKQNDPSLNCFKNKQTGEIFKQFVPTYPRKLTQNQLYSANSIILNQQRANNRQETFNNQHVLGTINIPSDLLYNENITSISINNISKDSTHIRQYFGPVNIQRLKISLYDNYGFLVNLNNHDWNFTLHVEQLYQY